MCWIGEIGAVFQNIFLTRNRLLIQRIKAFQDLTFPIQVYWTTDDPISNARSVPMFWKHVKNSGGIKIDCITPREIGVKKIGHFGFFRRKFKETLWTKALKDLENFIK